MQGTPLMGAVLAAEKPSLAMIPTMAIFIPASLLLVTHIWTLNDWSDYREDRVLDRQPSQADASELTRMALLRISIGSLIASLALFCLLPLQTLIIAGIIAILGFVYSIPGIRTKAVVLLAVRGHQPARHFHFHFLLAGFHGRSCHAGGSGLCRRSLIRHPDECGFLWQATRVSGCTCLLCHRFRLFAVPGACRRRSGPARFFCLTFSPPGSLVIPGVARRS